MANAHCQSKTPLHGLFISASGDGIWSQQVIIAACGVQQLQGMVGASCIQFCSLTASMILRTLHDTGCSQ
jgi:hypothetical protein